ncbi:MAG: dephospho-CoA kinase [Desulfobacteraceae bacterium]|nr:dephospho-CoA kinase [Desulfobacteraceae bacterium]
MVAGLTGGIATGKSTVSRVFQRAGGVVIDADIIARQVVSPGSPAYREIVNYFGEHILDENGGIDRETLGNIIFNDAAEKERLNRMVHPHVIDRAGVQVKRAGREKPDAVIILDVPLLLESRMDEGLAEIIVVYTPEDIQLKRLIARDKLTSTQALSRIRSQMPIEQKKKLGTIVIDNSGSLEDTEKQAVTVYHRLEERAVISS